VELAFHLNVMNGPVLHWPLVKEFGIAIISLNPMLLCTLPPEYANPRMHFRELFLNFRPFSSILYQPFQQRSKNVIALYCQGA